MFARWLFCVNFGFVVCMFCFGLLSVLLCGCCCIVIDCVLFSVCVVCVVYFVRFVYL